MLPKLNVPGGNHTGDRCTNCGVTIAQPLQLIACVKRIHIELQAFENRGAYKTALVKLNISLVRFACFLEIGLCLKHLQAQAVAVQTGQYLSFFNLVTFLDQNLDNFARNARKHRRLGIRSDRSRGLIGSEYVRYLRRRNFNRQRRGRCYLGRIRNFGFADAAGR